MGRVQTFKVGLHWFFTTQQRNSWSIYQMEHSEEFVMFFMVTLVSGNSMEWLG